MLLRYLKDPANAITVIGLAVSMLGIHLAILDRAALAVAAALWAFFIDHIDGIVAHRTRDRAQETAQIGRHLDSLTDLAGACILPAVILMSLNAYSVLSLAIGTALVVIGALRLAYYEAVRSPGGYFVGVPVLYTAPVMAIVVLLEPLFEELRLGDVLSVVVLILIALQLSTFRIPFTRGWMYAVVGAFTLFGSAALIQRSLPSLAF